jgi:hypothetical protein
VLTALDENANARPLPRPDADPTASRQIQIRRDRARAQSLGLTSQEIGETNPDGGEGTIAIAASARASGWWTPRAASEGVIRSKSQLERLPIFLDGNRQIRLLRRRDH